MGHDALGPADVRLTCCVVIEAEIGHVCSDEGPSAPNDGRQDGFGVGQFREVGSRVEQGSEEAVVEGVSGHSAHFIR